MVGGVTGRKLPLTAPEREAKSPLMTTQALLQCHEAKWNGTGMLRWLLPGRAQGWLSSALLCSVAPAGSSSPSSPASAEPPAQHKAAASQLED